MCGTFNVNGKDPPGSLTGWIVHDDPPELVVVGFQELQLDTDAYVGQYWNESEKYATR